MERLINAGNLKNNVVGPTSFVEPIQEWIDSQPTVEAIPVSWIESFLKNWQVTDESKYAINFVKNMIAIYRHTEEGK